MTATNRLRFRFQWRAVILLAAIWVLLWGDASLLNILYGALLGWLVTVVFWLVPGCSCARGWCGWSCAATTTCTRSGWRN